MKTVGIQLKKKEEIRHTVQTIFTPLFNTRFKSWVLNRGVKRHLPSYFLIFNKKKGCIIGSHRNTQHVEE